MSDEPIKFEEHMFDQIKMNTDKPSMPFEDCFQQGMGTEHMAPLLYSLIRFVRPQRILEIGLGYTTPFLIKGLEGNEQIHIDSNADMKYFKQPYDPKIICIDDMSDKVSSASQSALKYKDNKYVTVIESLFQGKAQEIKDKFGMIDFAWFDCGGHKEYAEFLKEYLPICSGYVLFHYTYHNGKPNPNYTEIETYVSNEEWERIDLIEPHKYRQGSFTMIKRRT